MNEGELRDLLAERLGRLEKAQTETNATLVDVLDTLKQIANHHVALRASQQQLAELATVVADRVDRVADRVDRLTEATLRGSTRRDEQFASLLERVERLERRHEPQ